MLFFQRSLCTRMLFQFLKSTMPLLSMTLLSIIVTLSTCHWFLIYTEKDILFIETWGGGGNERVIFIIVQPMSCVFLNNGSCTAYNLGGKYCLGWVLEVEEDYFDQILLLLKHTDFATSRCFRNSFFVA